MDEMSQSFFYFYKLTWIKAFFFIYDITWINMILVHIGQFFQLKLSTSYIHKPW